MIHSTKNGDTTKYYEGRAMRLSIGSGNDIIVVAENNDILRSVYMLILPGGNPKPELWKNVIVTAAIKGE
jgi:hypothetical protein